MPSPAQDERASAVVEPAYIPIASTGGRLRLLHVVTNLGMGGTEYGVLKLLRGLSNDLFEQRICAVRGLDPAMVSAQPLESEVFVAGRPEPGFQFPLFRLARIMRLYKPHIVHSRNWGSIEAIPAARLAAVPIAIHSEHGYDLESLSGLPLRRRIVARTAYAMADGVFAVTFDLRSYHARQAWVPAEKIRVIYNGVDTHRFAPRPDVGADTRKKLGIAPRSFVVGTVGRLVPIKDQKTLLLAVELLRQRGLDIHALLVGSGSELAKLEPYVAASAALAGRVLFTGAVETVPDLLNAMDVFVLPSISEGMSNTLLEAMATGLPTVATHAGGNPELVEKDHTGWLFSPGDFEGLAKYLLSLVHDAELRRRFGSAGRQRVLTLFNLERMLQDYRQLYLELAADRGLLRRESHSQPSVDRRFPSAVASRKDWRNVENADSVSSTATTQSNRLLRLAVLTGQDSDATRLSVSKLTQLPNVEIRGILLDSEPLPLKKRLRNLRDNLRREGFSFLYSRLLKQISSFFEKLATRMASQDEVLKLLRQSFPREALSLADFTRLANIPVLKVRNLNGVRVANALRQLDADLGVVLGTRVPERSTAAIPRMGCIYLRRGPVPEYGDLPPGSGEALDGQPAAGITVRILNGGLDTDEVLGVDSVPIHPKDSLGTLRKKLNLCGGELLARCVAQLAEGRAAWRPQPVSCPEFKAAWVPRERQTVKKLGLLAQRQGQWITILKTLVHLGIYSSGLFHLMRAYRKMTGTSRACVLLYHRVNDLTEDVLTTSVKRFAEQMVTLRKYYTVLPTSALVENVRSGERIPSNSIAIHFDDGYRDVYLQAAPILAHLRFPACIFVCSGHIDTDQALPHDAPRSPFQPWNLRRGEVLELTQSSLEVGSHTVSHVDLGQCEDSAAVTELTRSKQELESILGRPVTLLSYPYGREKNIRPGIVELVREAGYEAMFSAYGGYVQRKTHVFDIPRVGVNNRFRPLDLLLEIEGLSLGALRKRLLGKR